MKKVVLLVTTILFMLACSSESSIDLTESNESNSYKKIGGYDLKEEYLAMVESQSYIDYLVVSKEFHTNIAEGEEPDFEDAAEMLLWIENNLSQTTFSTYQDAEDQWTAVKSKIGIMIADNESFFDAYFETKPETLIGIIPLPEEGQTTSNCEQLCNSAFSACGGAAIKKLNDQLSLLADVSHSSPKFAARVDKAFSAYYKSMGSCNQAKGICLNKCTQTGPN